VSEPPRGPLIGGVIATTISWRAAFVFQAVIVAGHRRPPAAAESSIRYRPTPLTRSTLSARVPVGGRPDPRGDGRPASGQQRRAHGCSSGGRSGRPRALLSLTFVPEKRAGEDPLLSTALFPKPNVEPRPRHSEPAVAAADRNIVRRRRVPPGRARLQTPSRRA